MLRVRKRKNARADKSPEGKVDPLPEMDTIDAYKVKMVWMLVGTAMIVALRMGRFIARR